MGNSSSKHDHSFDETKIEFDLKLLDEFFKDTGIVEENAIKTEDLNKYIHQKIYINIFDENDKQINRSKIIQRIDNFIKTLKTNFENVFEMYFKNNIKEISKDDTKEVLIKIINICEYAFHGKTCDIQKYLTDFNGPVSCLYPNNKPLQTYSELSGDIYSNFPRLPTIFKNSILKILHYKYVQKITPAVTMDTNSVLNPVIFWFLCFTLPECFLKPPAPIPKNPNDQLYVGLDEESECGNWSLLYNSDIHGKSINRFKNHCFDYRAPTVVLIQLSETKMFILACDLEWREDTVFWGGFNCVLYQYLPSFCEIARGADIIYLKESSRTTKTGLRLGGSVDRPILCINSDFDACDINLNGYFNEKVQVLEVWGIGDKLADEKMKQQKKLNEVEILKRQQTKRNPGPWSENPDCILLELAGVNVSHSQER